MEWQQQILHTALLGTDKRALGTEALPPALQEVVGGLDSADKEEYFLQVNSLAFNFRQCGVLPVAWASLSGEPSGATASPASKADAETRPYCPPASMQALKDILDTENIPLLSFWLHHCSTKEQLIQPDLLPEVLSAAVQYKKLQLQVAACAGQRGAWLSKFNPLWNFSVAANNQEEAWQTGSPEIRKQVLREVRSEDPAKAREWLLQTWQQEDANTRAELLAILQIQIGEGDITFLESLTTDKSKKVKDLAAKLLKLIPSSAIVQLYMQVLREAVVLKKEKSVLGLLSKNTLQIALPDTIDDAVYRSGIEKLSNNKGLSDAEFILYQLVQVVPPTFWEQQLGYEPGGVLEILKKDRSAQKFIPAIVVSLVQQGDARWAEAIMDYCMEEGNAFYPEIIPLLPAASREGFMLQFFEGYPDVIIDHASQQQEVWGVELTRRILRHTAKNHYQYNRSFYQQHIQRIPAAIQQELSQLAPEQDYMRQVWNNTSTLISQLLQLKIQTVQSFNALK